MEGQQHLQDGQRPLRLPEQPVDPGRGCREVPDHLRELSHDAGHVPLRKHHPRETNPFFISKKKLDSLSKNIELGEVTLNQILGPKNEILLKAGTNVRLPSLT